MVVAGGRAAAVRKPLRSNEVGPRRVCLLPARYISAQTNAPPPEFLGAKRDTNAGTNELPPPAGPNEQSTNINKMNYRTFRLSFPRQRWLSAAGAALLVNQ